jgi:hypothetical protein
MYKSYKQKYVYFLGFFLHIHTDALFAPLVPLPEAVVKFFTVMDLVTLATFSSGSPGQGVVQPAPPLLWETK